MDVPIANATGFADWACDSRRSREERFAAEMLIEKTIGLWRRKQGVKYESNYEADRLRQKDRSLNPAYEPQFSRADAGRVEEILNEVKDLDLYNWDDRPVRDLSVIRFCPALEKLTTYRCEIRDWTPLLAVPRLRDLRVHDRLAKDFRPVAQLTELQVLDLSIDAPWPDLTGFERLSRLREFDFGGNVLALQAIPRLPALREAKFHQGYRFNVPLRSVGHLPEMPELRRLHLENTSALDGIERFPLLLNLEVYGYFEDLAPLAALKQLTHVTISGGDYATLAPLARLPELRRLVIRREEPQDCTPLAEAPRLHEIQVEMCPVATAELATLNAMFPPWDEEFAVTPPRPLEPLRLLVRDKYEDRDDAGRGEPRDWGEDKEMTKSEERWFTRETNRRLTALLGKGWGRCASTHVTITRPEDIDRLPEIAQCLRQLLATARDSWSYMFIVDSLARFERGMEEIQRDDDEFDAENERQEWEDRRRRERERREYLEREYRYRLQQEQGLPTRPEDFAPPPKAEPESDDTVVAGDIEPETAEFDTGVELSLYSTLTETACYIHSRDLGLAEMLLNLKAEV